MRGAVGVVLLLAQLAAVVYARFTPARWLCWAPNDSATQFRLTVTVDGRPLTPAAVQTRYQLPRGDWSENPPANLIAIVRQYEQTYGRGDGAVVALRYRLNGHEERTWSWPVP